MGILEKLDKRAYNKEKSKSLEDMNDILRFLEDYEVEGLQGVISEIYSLVESGFYEKFMRTFREEAYAKLDRVFTLEELDGLRVLKLARANLHFGGIFNTIFTPSLVTAKQMVTIFMMIQYTYVIFSGRTMDWNDALNIYFSRLDERIIFALDLFDEVELEELPEPTAEYFKALKKLKWSNKNTKNLYNKINDFFGEIQIFVMDYPPLGEEVGWITDYRVAEDLFIQTLAGCSAVNDGRLEVESEDVIKAYNTFFKLIKTDVTKYKAIPELVQDIEGYNGPVVETGYLVCKNCGGYYKLQPGESPDDFDRCQCGGELEYSEGIDFEDH
ncbi:hypothetical protein J2756_001168 [Methanobacterium aggregans]|nr:hypothetical protein [Methanobacterium aggregans]